VTVCKRDGSVSIRGWNYTAPPRGATSFIHSFVYTVGCLTTGP